MAPPGYNEADTRAKFIDPALHSRNGSRSSRMTSAPATAKSTANKAPPESRSSTANRSSAATAGGGGLPAARLHRRAAAHRARTARPSRRRRNADRRPQGAVRRHRRPAAAAAGGFRLGLNPAQSRGNMSIALHRPDTFDRRAALCQGRRVAASLHVPRAEKAPALLLYLRESATRHPWPDTLVTWSPTSSRRTRPARVHASRKIRRVPRTHPGCSRSALPYVMSSITLYP